MDEPQVAVAEPTGEAQVSKEGVAQPQPNPLEEELRKVQSAKDKEIAAVQQQNALLAQQLEQYQRQADQARIASIEDPEERANEIIKAKEAELERRAKALELHNEARSRPIVAAILSQQHGVPIEVLQPAKTYLEMENLALKWKLENTGKELEKVKTAKEPPAATTQKFAQGSGQAPSSYDPSKYRGTGDIAGSLRAKREAGL